MKHRWRNVFDWVILCIFIIMFSLFVLVNNANGSDTYKASFLSNYDGDTVTLMVNVFSVPPTYMKATVRVFGIDSPEIKGKCDEEKALALKARKFVNEVLSSAKDIQIQVIGKGKYGRVIAIIYYDEQDLSSTLIEQGYARIYHNDKRGTWCGQDV